MSSEIRSSVEPRASTSRTAAERRPLMITLGIPRTYGSVFPYYKFLKDTLSESVFSDQDKVLIKLDLENIKKTTSGA
ncbi:hypothetical protein MSG28_003369 [Choristoneura fumiferana]|uniref:Uncharacterized protein n=1 Tax=Choristoneura fumiferana TaxID=7141 RepID=A0ACC0KEJ0_CHOFU|nr:hypothetical protein MSG28_003369 [Choristoneura fumiferana]